MIKPILLYAQSNDNRIFHHLTSVNGLSNNDVQRVLQSSNGDIWIGTVNGLNKYDGYQFTIYTSDPNDNNTISNRFSYELIEDNEGNIWIGTLNGLNKFDASTETFTHFLAGKENSDISSNMVRTLLADDRYLWIGTSAGFDMMDLQTKKIKNIIKDRIITDIINDGAYIWLATLYHGLNRYKKSTGEISEFTLPQKPLMRALVKDGDTVWVATDKGVIPFNTKTLKLDANQYLLRDKIIREIVIDADKNLWIGTHLHGLYIYSIKTRKFKKVIVDSNDNFFLPGSSVNTLMIDTNNILWVGGTSHLSYSSLDRPVSILRTSNAGLISNGIGRITKANDNKLWITSENGVNLYNKSGNKSYPIGSIYKVLVNNRDTIAVGESGLYRYNPIKDNFEDYSRYIDHAYKENTIKSDRNLRFTSIIYLGENKYLLGTYDGVICWNTKNNEVKLSRIVEGVDTERFKNIIYSFFQYGDDILVGTPKGLYIYNRDDATFKPYDAEGQPTIISRSEIFGIDIDENNNLWISTNNGLLKTKHNRVINHYTVSDGLLDNTIKSVIISDGILWAATDKGLSAFAIENNRFDRIYLNSSHFNKSFVHESAYIDKQGVMYFGTNQGLLYFNKEDFLSQSQLPKTTITNFRLFNRSVPVGSELLPYHISKNKHLVLNHKQNMLNFEFSSYNIMQPEHLYAYQLQGFTEDQHWIITDARHRQATFTPTPGKYVFRVKSGWDENQWSNEITELKITILPPWWKTIWAYILYVLVLLVIIMVIYLVRTRQIRLQAENLERQVVERTAKIQKQKMKIEQQSLELANAIRKKEQIFTNISHEFRTPLTLIISPLKQILHLASEAQKKSILLIQSNAFRLLRLVNQLLELSQLRADYNTKGIITDNKADCHDDDSGDSHQLNSHEKDTVPVQRLMDAILPSFTQLADSKKIKLYTDIDNIVICCSYDELEKIITNLLSNAIKYTLTEGTIHLSVKKADNNQCSIKITDTGIGIPEDQLDNIFEPFVRVKNYSNMGYIEGSGIGLSLVKELVSVCNGTIEVDSKPDQGTTFNIKLPIIQSEGELSQLHEGVYYENMQIDHINLEIMDLSEKIREDLLQDQASHEEVDARNTNINHYTENDKPLLLIIEDNPEMRRHLQILCSDYYCLPASNGIEGVKFARKYVPDIIISDVMMPGIDGYNVVTELKEDMCTSHIPIILLSALNDRDHRLKGLIKKADEYMTKPFDSDELLIRLDNLLAIRQLVKKYFFQHSVIDRNNKVADSNWGQFGDVDKVFIKRFKEIIESHYKDESLTQETISEKMSMSCRQIQRKLKSLIDLSPVEFLRSYRIDRSVELLKQGHQIEHIAYEVGFSSRNYFSSCFKAKMGVTPKQYQINLTAQRKKIHI